MKKQEEIEAAILNLIKHGAVAPGERLPSIRKLATRYRMSITPVTEAFRHLEAQGLVESRPNAGYYVSQSVLSHPIFADQHKNLNLYFNERYEMLDERFSNYGSIAFNSKSNITIPLGATAASTHFYPCEELNAHLARECRQPLSDENYQVKLHDELDLKQGIMKWMIPCGSPVSIDELSLFSGVSQALTLCLRACTEPGGLVAVESPGHVGFFFQTEFLRLKVLPVPSNPGTGLDVNAFSRMLKTGPIPSCLVLCSNFSNPTGALMPDAAKLALVQLCSRYEIPIIEDDILGDIYFGAQRPRPLKSFDPDNVLYISGFGKALSPALRTAWVAAGRHKDALAFYKHLTASYIPSLLQHGLASFLASGAGARHLERFRSKIECTIQTYCRAVRESFPEGTVAELPKGGLYLWVRLPEGMDAALLSDQARVQGISVSPAQIFNAPQQQWNCFRINCAAVPWSDQVHEGIVRLGQIAAQLKKDTCRP